MPYTTTETTTNLPALGDIVHVRGYWRTRNGNEHWVNAHTRRRPTRKHVVTVH